MSGQSSTPSASELYRLWRARGEAAARRPCVSLRVALVLWLIVAAAVAARTFVRPNSHTVFPIFAASADHWWSDQALYANYPPLDRFRYPPLFAVLVTPFAAASLLMGGILWSWAGMAVYVAGLWAFARDVIPSAWRRRRIAVFLMLGALGALRGLWNAQSNALIVGLLLLGAAALARAVRDGRRGTASGRTWWLAALFLAAAVCLKLTPLAPVLLLTALWPRRLAGRLLVAAIAFCLVPFFCRPPLMVLEHYREWLHHLLGTGDGRWPGFRDGWTIWLVLRHWLDDVAGPLSLREPMDASWYRLLQLATAAAVLLWCLWQRRRADRLGLGSRWLVHVTLGMGLAWLMLFGPAVEHATYVFLTPPLAWAVLEREAWPRGRGLILAAFVFVMVLGWGALSRLVGPGWPALLTALPLGTALFALWLLGYAAQTVRSADSRGPAMRIVGAANTFLAPKQATTIPS